MTDTNNTSTEVKDTTNETTPQVVVVPIVQEETTTTNNNNGEAQQQQQTGDASTTTTTAASTTTTATTTNDTASSAPTTTPPTTTTTTTNKRKEVDTPKYIETRIRKKAREALDLISNTKQRQASLFNLLGSNYTGPSEQQLEMIFRIYSGNKDTIGAEQLKVVLNAIGKKPVTRRITKILNELDKNQTGVIDVDSFVHYMQKKAAEKAKSLGLLDSSDEEDEVEEEAGGDTDEEKEDTPKKKAATAKPKKRAASKKPAATKKSTTTTATTSNSTATTKPFVSTAKQPSFFQPLKRGSSIIQYYTENAGVHTVNNATLDSFSNPSGLEFDLGVEGAFTEFTILIGKFYATNLECINELKSKGFNIVEALTQKQFVDLLPTSNVALIISGASRDSTTTDDVFVDAVEDFHKKGNGLFIWNDNAPYTAQGNLITKRLFKGLEAHGNEPGTKTLTLGDGTKAGHFNSHLVTSGIVNLYEGITISSYPKTLPVDSLQILATSSQGNSIMLVSDNSKMEENLGRVVIDCGFTKLFANYFTAGTGRYIKNACVWLLSLDHRFKLGQTTTGEIQKPIEVPVWQFQHGSWLDYDVDASKVVEETYQEYLKNPHIDVRSIKSGHWCYNIDFKQNTQTNIQHEAHTTRPIRRVLKNVVAQTA